MKLVHKPAWQPLVLSDPLLKLTRGFRCIWFGWVIIIPNHLYGQSNADQQLSETSAQNQIALFAAAMSNDAAGLEQALESGGEIDSKNNNGETALLIATHQNSIDAAKLLIDLGADVNAKDNLGDSPYLYAGAEGRLEILKMTISAGADLKSVNRYGGTALTPAAHHGYIDIVAYMLTTKIEIDQINFLGWTALLEAVMLGDGGINHQKIVKLLLAAGADKTLTDADNVSPLQHADSRGYSEIVRLLEE